MKWSLIIGLLITSNDGMPKTIEYKGRYEAQFSSRRECEVTMQMFTISDYERDGVFVYEMECKEIKK